MAKLASARKACLPESREWSVVPLRLTASGHEFAEAMGHSKAFAAVKSSLVTSSLSVMKEIAVAAFKAELSRHGANFGL
jgi:hypothetical protein